jgi:hypothetical protein
VGAQRRLVPECGLEGEEALDEWRHVIALLDLVIVPIKPLN